MLTTSLPLSHCHEFQRIEIAMSTIILRISSSSRGGECCAGAPRLLPAALRGPRQRRSAPPLLSRMAGRRGLMVAQRSASRAASHSARRSLPPACPPSGAAPPSLCAPAPSRPWSARAFSLRVAASRLAAPGARASAAARRLAASPPRVRSPATATLALAAAARL